MSKNDAKLHDIKINNIPILNKQLSNTVTKIGNYILSKSIGNGAFGKVHTGIHTITGQKVAIKVIQKNRLKYNHIQRVKKQINNLSKLHHPSIVHLYEFLENQKHLFLVMQYLPEGQLFNYIVQSKKLDEKQACRIFQAIISAVEYFHRCGVAHRDLKPQNILIDSDRRVKIIDFGLSNSYKQNQKLKTSCGSPCYVAPQMIQGKNLYQPIMVDIWSTGVILYAMLCGCLPFSDDSPKKIYDKIMTGRFKVPKTMSSEAKNLLSRIFTLNPQKRITIQQIRQHKWWEIYPEQKIYGIISNKHCIPIDEKIKQKMIAYHMNTSNFDNDIAKKKLTQETATYYILLKKFVREGGVTQCYLGSKHFNPNLLYKKQIQMMEEIQSTEMTFSMQNVSPPQPPILVVPKSGIPPSPSSIIQDHITKLITNYPYKKFERCQKRGLSHLDIQKHQNIEINRFKKQNNKLLFRSIQQNKQKSLTKIYKLSKIYTQSQNKPITSLKKCRMDKNKICCKETLINTHCDYTKCKVNNQHLPKIKIHAQKIQ